MPLDIIKSFQDTETEVIHHLCKIANSYHCQKVQKETIPVLWSLYVQLFWCR